jgi:hypothetical protein
MNALSLLICNPCSFLIHSSKSPIGHNVLPVYDYDKNDRLKTVIPPNGTSMFRVYDTAGHLLQQKEIVIETGEIISQFDFEYDAAGNIIKEKATSEADIDINNYPENGNAPVSILCDILISFYYLNIIKYYGVIQKNFVPCLIKLDFQML